MTDIQKIDNWTEVSRGYYRYVVAAKVCYELMALQQGAKTGPDYYALYVTGEWKDPTGTPYFKRECLESCETLANCLYTASKDLKANPCGEEQTEFEVTEEDIQNIKDVFNRGGYEVYSKELHSIAKIILATYEKLSK